MHEAPEPAQLGKKLATQSPWLLIAILSHAVVVAIASILYYEHGAARDDAEATAIAFTAPPTPLAVMLPPVIVDRDAVPKIQQVAETPDDLIFDPAASTEPEAGNSNEPDASREFVGLPGDDGGSTAIGGGAGHYSTAPSANTGRLGPRKHGQRFQTGTKEGGGFGKQASEAVTLGLLWLKNHQDEDGHWDADQFMKHDTDGVPCTGPGNAVHDVGVTGLALLAFLGEGNTLKEGSFRKVVRKGIRWLVEQQDADTGLIGAPTSQGYMYSHAIAALAVCEAFGLSEHRPLQKPAQSAINYIVQARNPYGVWRYEPRSADGDTSVTAWMVQALLSAREFGLLVDDAALKATSAWFHSVTDDVTGAAGYTRRGEGSSRPIDKVEKFPAARTEALTSAVLLCRYLMHEQPKDVPTMNLAAETILRKLPTWNPTDGSIDMYYWYYASYALYQVSGRPWEIWSRKMNAAAIQTQQKDGNAKGSWDPVDAWGDEGGRIYSTAIMVLCLEAYYRYDRVLGGR